MFYYKSTNNKKRLQRRVKRDSFTSIYNTNKKRLQRTVKKDIFRYKLIVLENDRSARIRNIFFINSNYLCKQTITGVRKDVKCLFEFNDSNIRWLKFKDKKHLFLYTYIMLTNILSYNSPYMWYFGNRFLNFLYNLCKAVFHISSATRQYANWRIGRNIKSVQPTIEVIKTLLNLEKVANAHMYLPSKPD